MKIADYFLIVLYEKCRLVVLCSVIFRVCTELLRSADFKIFMTEGSVYTDLKKTKGKLNQVDGWGEYPVIFYLFRYVIISQQH